MKEVAALRTLQVRIKDCAARLDFVTNYKWVIRVKDFDNHEWIACELLAMLSDYGRAAGPIDKYDIALCPSVQENNRDPDNCLYFRLWRHQISRRMG